MSARVSARGRVVGAAILLACSAALHAQRSGDEMARDTLGGAAKGAVIGGIAGDAGKGAAAGAVGGAVFGGMERRTPDTPGGDLVSGCGLPKKESFEPGRLGAAPAE
jgi:hypothetical protein